MSKRKHPTLLDLPENWEKEWQGMPEFVLEDLSPYKTIQVHFKNKEDVIAFSKLVEQRITPQTKWIWYPKITQKDLLSYRYIDVGDR